MVLVRVLVAEVLEVFVGVCGLVIVGRSLVGFIVVDLLWAGLSNLYGEALTTHRRVSILFSEPPLLCPPGGSTPTSVPQDI